MTLPPPPALLAGVVLLGWPLIHLASVLAAMRPRAKMRALAADLRKDMADDPHSLRIINETVKESHGEAVFVVFPIIIPLAILAISLYELFGRDRPSRSETPEIVSKREKEREDWRKKLAEVGLIAEYARILSDPRYNKLKIMSFEISLIRWPMVAMLTIMFSLPFLPLFGLAYGLRESASVIPDLARRFSAILRLSPQGL